jgi:hypothetical protein
VFILFAGEPPLERAIKFESAVLSRAAPEPPIVSRSTQRSAGLFTAHLVYGGAIGGVFSLIFVLALGRAGDFGPRSLAGLLAIGGFVALVLVPELKYPANSPAIGAPETIGARTELYFVMLGISLLATAAAAMLAQVLIARLGSWNGAIISTMACVVTTAVAAPPCQRWMRSRIAFLQASCGNSVLRRSAHARFCGVHLD